MISQTLHDIGVPKDTALFMTFEQFPDLRMPAIGLKNFCKQADNKLADIDDERKRVRDTFASNPDAFKADIEAVRNGILKPVAPGTALQRWVIDVDNVRRNVCMRMLDIVSSPPQDFAAVVSPLETLPCGADTNDYVIKLEDALRSKASTLTEDEHLVLDLVSQYRRTKSPPDVCNSIAALRTGDSSCATELDECRDSALDQGRLESYRSEQTAMV